MELHLVCFIKKKKCDDSNCQLISKREIRIKRREDVKASQIQAKNESFLKNTLMPMGYRKALRRTIMDSQFLDFFKLN